MNKHIFQWKSVANAGVKWREGSIGGTQVFRKGFWLGADTPGGALYAFYAAANKQYLLWADAGDWTPLHMAD